MVNTSERLHVTAERSLDAAWLSFDLPVLLQRIKAEPAWRSSSRNAMTLMKGRGQRIVLIAMYGKAEIPLHRTDGQLSLQVIEGALRVHSDAQVVDLTAGGFSPTPTPPSTTTIATPQYLPQTGGGGLGSILFIIVGTIGFGGLAILAHYLRIE